MGGPIMPRRVRFRRKAPRRKSLRFSIFMLMLMYVVVAGDNSKKTDEESVRVLEAEAVAGGVAKIACDMYTTQDNVMLVIWFKDGISFPIYSFDARGMLSLEEAKHWSDDALLGGRAYFRYEENPAWLTVENVRETDAGTYRCRVDFKGMRTRNTRVNLTVLVPPERLMVMDEEGTVLPGSHVILGPRTEGSLLNITCIASGGKPPPRVTWWRANALLDDTYEDVGDRTVKNTLIFERLTRRDLHTVLTCQALNNNITMPLSIAVTIDMNLAPLKVVLVGDNVPLSAENEYNVQCDAVGARPPPELTWWKGGVPLRNAVVRISEDDNLTSSILTLVPTMEDSGKLLMCRAITPLVPIAPLEDAWKLNIYHVPVVSLELGVNLNATHIREGIDVYFECNIKSNPWVYKVSWRHNGHPLNSNMSAGAIVSNQSLVLQSVTRGRSGIYTCVASNLEGDGESNPVFLDVKYIPQCKPMAIKTYGVARGEPARVLCKLDANPTDVHFTWKFNNTNDAVDLPASLVTADRLQSIATYTPMTELDYGTLLCWGRNEVGTQHEPCVFSVVPAGKPDPLSNCSVLNQTVDALHVECNDGFDGGLSQHFFMDVYDSATHTLVRNVNASAPIFTVGGLKSNTGFNVQVYAANAKGRSEPIAFPAFTLKAPEKRTATPAIFNITPILGTLIGAVAALVLLAIIIVVVLRLRGHSGDDSKQREGSGSEENERTGAADKAISIPLSKDNDESIDSQEEKNPDIIPQNNDTDFQDPDEKAFAKLNNAPNRIFAGTTPRVHSPSARIYENTGNIATVPKPPGKPVIRQPRRDEVTYAELALAKQQAMYAGIPQTPAGARRPEPTVYAQIDMSKQIPPQQRPHHHTDMLHQQPLDGNTASASLPLLHHHHLAAAYTPHPHQPTLRLLSPPGPPGQHPPMSTLGPLGPFPPDDELPACAETPLLPAPATRESTRQPLLQDNEGQYYMQMYPYVGRRNMVGRLAGPSDLPGHGNMTIPRITATRF